MHRWGLPVVVRGECLSACAFIALAARKLTLTRGGRVGVHQAYDVHGIPDLRATRLAARLLRQYGARRSAMTKMHYDPSPTAGERFTSLRSGKRSGQPAVSRCRDSQPRTRIRSVRLPKTDQGVRSMCGFPSRRESIWIVYHRVPRAGWPAGGPSSGAALSPLPLRASTFFTATCESVILLRWPEETARRHAEREIWR